MLRAASSTLARRVAPSFSRSLPACSAVPRLQYHASRKREDETNPADAGKTEEKGFWDPVYSIPVGIAFAVPALQYEWILINEETQLAACFIAFTAIIWKQFGGTIKEALESDGKRIIEEHNKVEDEIIGMLQDKVDDIKMQSRIVQDAEDIKALKIQTYEKLNAAGQVKPQYEFKHQIERMLNIVEAEEVNVREKAKHAMMEEATAKVMSEFATNDALKKKSLANAIATLKGGKSSGDPVKETYLKYFQDKAAAAKKIDEKAETNAARANIITKLNAIAKSEGFFFEFGPDGKPKMVV